MDAKSARIHVMVKGRVQGVGFRASTQSEAQKLAVHGWVRNLPNGNVEFVAEGRRESLEKLLAWAKKGSTTAAVNDIQVRWGAFTSEFTEFAVQH